MNNSKLNQTELSYENSTGTAKVNLYTGRLLYEQIEARVGLNSYNLSLSHIYNSQFSLPEGMSTNMSNKWKLSAQEYLYSNEDNTYTYIDSLGMVHIFELLEGTEYYDTSGMGLTLDSITNTISDMTGNKMIFTNGLLVKTISAENNEEEKIYEYNNDKLVLIYDKRNENDVISIEYNENNLLSKISVIYKGNLQYVKKYFYDEERNLTYITKESKEGVEKIETMYNYEENKLHYAASFLDKQGFRFEYGNLGKVSEVRTGIVNIIEESSLVENTSLYVGDDIYLGEDNYLGETYIKKTYRIGESISVYGNDLISKNTINYVFPKITITNELGIMLTYYVNEEGTTVSVFEQKGSDLKTLNKRLGVLMLSKKSSTIETINTQKSYEINTNNVLCNSQEEITINDNYGVRIFLNNEFENVQEYIKTNITNYQHYMCSFYLKTLDSFTNPKVVLTTYEENDVVHSKEVKFDGKAKDSWQIVNIPIMITEEIKGISLRFEEQNHNIEIADMRLCHTNYNSLLVGTTENFELDMIEEIKYSLNDNEYTLSETDYITTKDLYLTAISKNQNDNTFSLFYNDGKKRKKVNSVQLKGTETYIIEQKYTETLGYFLPIYSSKSLMKNNNGIVTIIKSIVILKQNPLTGIIQDNIGVITWAKFPNPDNNEENLNTCTYEVYDLKGKMLGYQDEYGVQTIYEYEENNQKITQTIKNKVGYDNILKTTTTFNDNIETITDTTDSYEIEYNVVTGAVQSEKLNNKKTKKYFYNTYDNNIQAIKFINEEGEEQLHRFITSNNKLTILTDGVNKYLYKYYLNGNLQKVIDQKENIDRYTWAEQNESINQKEIEITNNGHTSYSRYDLYGKLQEISKEPYTLTITPQTIWESSYSAQTEKVEIKKEIQTEEYTYEYDNNNVLNKFTINKENDKIECEITSSGTKIYSNEDTSPSNDASLLYPGLYGQVYQYGQTYDSSKAITPRLKSSDNIVGYQNVEVDMSSKYEYDDIGRLSSKEMLVTEDSLFGDRKFRKDYMYLPNTYNILECNTKLYKVNKGDELFNYKFVYGYQDGKLNSIQNNDNIWTYEYNGLNQLKREEYNSQIKAYKYRKNGDIEKVVDDNNNILKSWTYDDLDKLTSIKDETGNDIISLEYDADNNIEYYTKDNIKYKLTWEYGKQLKKIEKCHLLENGEEECYPYVEYQYDIMGRRIKKILTREETNEVTTTEYFYDGNKLLYEDIYYPSYTCKRIIYVYDVEGISGFVVVNGTSYSKYYYIKDILGNIVGIADQDEILITYKYDAWGNQEVYYTREEDYIYNLNKLNPFRYRGYYYDVETGWFWLSSRYYSPELCRFISPDSVEYLNPESINGLNLYCYCLNNPIMYADPSGHWIETVFDIGFIIWDIYNLCTNDGHKDWKNWAALGFDILFAALPIVTGGGGNVIKLANVGDDLHDMSKVTVVGETMNRVQNVSQFVNATDNLYDGYQMYGVYSTFGKTGKLVAEVGGKVDNALWLLDKLRDGYTIVDIGIDSGRLIRSSSYAMERAILWTWRYRNRIKLAWHLTWEVF